MRLNPLLTLAPLLIALPAAAQPPGGGGGGFGGPPRILGPSPELARQAAETAVKACERMGYKTFATVVDITGQPVVAMTADPQLNKELAPLSVRRARISATFQAPSSEIADRVGTDAGLYYQIQGDPRLRPAKPGGVPLSGPDRPRGAIGVAGAPDDMKDEACARAGVKAIAAQLSRPGPRGPGGPRGLGGPRPAGAGGAAPAEESRKGEGQE